MTTKRRFTVELTDAAHSDLTRVCRAIGGTKAGTVRKALALLAALSRLADADGNVHVRSRGDGAVHVLPIRA